MNLSSSFPDTRFKVLQRETMLIAGLITAGHYQLRQIAKDSSFYYQAFYSQSLALERLMKLIIHLEDPNANIRNFSHDLVKLANHLKLEIDPGSIEYAFLVFYNDFAKKDRYSLLDYLNSNSHSSIEKEPIKRFYEEIILKILEVHPPKKHTIPKNYNDITHTMVVKGNLTWIDKLDELLKDIEMVRDASIFASMYIGRIFTMLISTLKVYDGKPNPCFSEIFSNFPRNDKDYKERKTIGFPVS